MGFFVKRQIVKFGFVLMLSALGSVVYGAGHDATNLSPLAAAIAIGLGALLQQQLRAAASSALEGISRNPTAKGDVFAPLLLSLVFMEFQALLCFAIAFMVKG